MDRLLKNLREQYIRLYESEKLKGGLADGKSLEDIANKHGVSIEDIQKQFAMGVKVEMEHTHNKNVAKEVASDHLWEDGKYYTKLKKMENE